MCVHESVDSVIDVFCHAKTLWLPVQKLYVGCLYGSVRLEEYPCTSTNHSSVIDVSFNLITYIYLDV